MISVDSVSCRILYVSALFEYTRASARLTSCIAFQIACRCPTSLPLAVVSKISMFCHVANEQVLAVHDVSSLYHVPLLLKNQGLLNFLKNRLRLDKVVLPEPRIARGTKLLTMWKDLTISYAPVSVYRAHADLSANRLAFGVQIRPSL